ncbi:MAG: hypothetical protein HY694_00075 [Deltaproteobacteria bacterium]|nr:hypothetical protein [Deltaproteobacteria bacterium]
MEAKILNANPETDAVAIIERLLSGGDMLPEQLPSASHWSAEEELAAAVLMDALVEARDFHGHPLHKRKVSEDLQWIFSDDREWPFSFVQLCAHFELDPAQIRRIVLGWVMGSNTQSQKQLGRYRPAARVAHVGLTKWTSEARTKEPR